MVIVNLPKDGREKVLREGHFTSPRNQQCNIIHPSQEGIFPKKKYDKTVPKQSPLPTKTKQFPSLPAKKETTKLPLQPNLLKTTTRPRYFRSSAWPGRLAEAAVSTPQGPESPCEWRQKGSNHTNQKTEGTPKTHCFSPKNHSVSSNT